MVYRVNRACIDLSSRVSIAVGDARLV